MNNILNKKWIEFPLDSLFIISGSKTSPKLELDLKEVGKYPYITTAATNNGVNGYSNNFTEIGNVISVDSAVTGQAFYQEQNFTASDHVEKLIPLFEMNEKIALFIVTVLNKTSEIYGYAYNEKRSQTSLKKEKIPLPVDESNLPDWNFMEDYMTKICQNEKNDLDIILETDFNNKKIDISKWKRFHLYDEELFEIDMGSKLDKSKMKETNPSINFVGRSSANNGVTAKVDIIANKKPYKKGNLTISLGGEYLGSCFIQEEDFYTSQNVNVLIPKREMSLEVKQFIATMVFKESRTYYKAFIEELNKHIKTDFSFYLPVKENGKIDWEYMENYMKKVNKMMENEFEKIIKIKF